ncbi:hypothetical protein XENTR_v10016378 [Xenopus tropicalis]|nr:hypothetical protein XENTR_v10016378 [Xenopus tropicalis]
MVDPETIHYCPCIILYGTCIRQVMAAPLNVKPTLSIYGNSPCMCQYPKGQRQGVCWERRVNTGILVMGAVFLHRRY